MTGFRRRTARAWVCAVGLALVIPVLAAGSASADPYTDIASTAVVTRLTVTDGRGWLTMQLRFWGGGIVGFTVAIPAAGGSWDGPADVAVPALNTHCGRGPGPDLWYACGVTTSYSNPDAWTDPKLPAGSFTVTIPVTRTGSLAGLTGLAGQTMVYAESSGADVFPIGDDTFPVYDAAHWRSTAEVRSATVAFDGPSDLAGRLTVPVSLDAMSGEHVSAVDVLLPRGGTWTLESSTAESFGATCVVRTSTPGDPLLQCVGRGGTALATGRYQIVARLHFSGVDLRYLPPQRVGLAVDGQTTRLVDSFRFDSPYR